MKQAKILAALALLGCSLVPISASAQLSNTPEIAAKLGSMGTELSREFVGGTMALYAPIHAVATDDGLTVNRDLAYGSHERQRLDVHAPQEAEGLPVLVFVHGGGFVRGDKGDIANIGRWFAQHGVVTVSMNYRFAPEVQWPAGAEDVASVLAWIGENIADLGGDAMKVVIAGNSAGAMHVADYTFREQLQLENDGVVGSILISPPTVDLENRAVDPQRDAKYYGVDGDRAEQSVVNAVAGREIPVLVAYAEYEPAVISDQTRRLITALAERDGRLPLVNAAAGHNHISIVSHIGSADQTLAPDMLEFISLLTLQGR